MSCPKKKWNKTCDQYTNTQIQNICYSYINKLKTSPNITDYDDFIHTHSTAPADIIDFDPEMFYNNNHTTIKNERKYKLGKN
jgi:hypothetical protein